MNRRRRTINPLTQLAIAMLSAARNIHEPAHRRIAEDAAEKIWKSRVERFGGGKKGEMARAGRALLGRLMTVPADQLEETAEKLRGYADAISGRFEVTREDIYRGRRSRAG